VDTISLHKPLRRGAPSTTHRSLTLPARPRARQHLGSHLVNMRLPSFVFTQGEWCITLKKLGTSPGLKELYR
jgi:hypothetical protein